MAGDIEIIEEARRLFDKVRNKHVYVCSEPGESEAPCAVCGENWRNTSNHVIVQEQKPGWSNPEFRIQLALEAASTFIAKAAQAEAREAAGSVRIPAPEVAPDVQEYGEKQSAPTIVNTAYKSGFVDGVNALRAAIRSMEVE